MSPLRKHFASALIGVLRQPSGFLQHPFLVPGGLYGDEQWDWDSYWMVRGYLKLLKGADVLPTFLDHARGTWINFFKNQSENGSVPIMSKSNNPDFFRCCTPSDSEKNQAKPVFGMLALEVSQASGSFEWVRPYFDQLLFYYARWSGHYRSGCGLLVWGSDIAIGVDCDPTTYGRPDFSSANLLLNCFFYKDLLAAAEIAESLGRGADSERLLCEAAVTRAALQRECWDDIDAFYYTVDVHCVDRRHVQYPTLKKGMDMSWRTIPLKTKMFTGFLPLWCGIATSEQARLLVERHLRNEQEFAAPKGIRTMAMTERMYDATTDSANPSNWLGPVWVVANYMVYEGLRGYGFDNDANDLARKTRDLLTDDLEKTGTLHENYHPENGAPNFNADFLSWNVLAAIMD